MARIEADCLEGHATDRCLSVMRVQINRSFEADIKDGIDSERLGDSA